MILKLNDEKKYDIENYDDEIKFEKIKDFLS